MAQVNIEAIIEHLDHDLRRALEATIEEHVKGSVDSRAFFRTFVRQVSRKCSTWENVPDELVKVNE